MNLLKILAAIDDDRVSNDELVISIGTTETISLDGLKGISTDQWYRNIVIHHLKYDIKDLLEYAPTLAKQVSGILPVNSLLSLFIFSSLDLLKSSKRFWRYYF